MSRGVGVAETLHAELPDWFVLLFGIITQLGDTWFLWLLLGVLFFYHPSDREGILLVAAMALVGAGLLETLKVWFAWPRPPTAAADPGTLTGLLATLYELTVPAGGFGFPSGHALGAAVVYLGLAFVLPDRSPGRWRMVAVGTVALVAASRVIIGVHYVVDVVAGVVIGATIVAGGFTLHRRVGASAIPRLVGLGVGLSLLNLALRGVELEAMALLVVTTGAVVVWRLADQDGAVGVHWPGSS